MTLTALVTGANGFIGSHLVAQLQRSEWNVAGMIHHHRDRAEKILKPSNIYLPPQTTEEATGLLNRVRPDTIFHLAATSASKEPDDIDKILSTNIVLGATLLEAAARLKPKPQFVVAGSFWEYSDGVGYSPNSLYAATKRCLHDLVVYYRERHELRAISLILYDTYGPDDPRNKLWNQIIKAECGSTIPLTAGEQLIDLVHVRDVVSAFIIAAQLLSASQLSESAYAVRSSARDSLRSIAETISSLINSGVHLKWGSLPYRPIEIFKPWSGPLLPGWSPQVTLEDGIRELLPPAN